jgi:hypothetical protein
MLRIGMPSVPPAGDGLFHPERGATGPRHVAGRKAWLMKTASASWNRTSIMPKSPCGHRNQDRGVRQQAPRQEFRASSNRSTGTWPIFISFHELSVTYRGRPPDAKFQYLHVIRALIRSMLGRGRCRRRHVWCADQLLLP